MIDIIILSTAVKLCKNYGIKLISKNNIFYMIDILINKDDIIYQNSDIEKIIKYIKNNIVSKDFSYNLLTEKEREILKNIK